jgi:hypothetical protein
MYVRFIMTFDINILKIYKIEMSKVIIDILILRSLKTMKRICSILFNITVYLL